MTRPFLLAIAALALGMSGGCSSDDTVVVPPVEIYEARADVSNFLVGDGTVDTRMSMHMGTDLTVVENLQPNGTSLDAGLLLAAPQEDAILGISLSVGDGTILNAGEVFTLTRDRRYLFMACGHVGETTGALKPTLLQMTPLAKPGAGRVQFRFVHALAGNPIAVDVHVNGEIISNVAYGAVSAPVSFAARSVGQDELLVVATGVVPDGTNEIWKSTGHLLFVMDEHYDSVLAHHPKSVFDGDVNGQPAMEIIQSPY